MARLDRLQRTYPDRHPATARTLIYSRGGGRTCDQLMTLAQFVALAEEFSGEFTVVDLPFWPYCDGFAAFVKNRICAVPVLPRRGVTFVLRAWERVVRIPPQGMWRGLSRVRERLHWRLTRGLERWAAREPRTGFWVGGGRVGDWENVPGRRREFLHLDDPEVLADLRRHSFTVVCGPRVRCWSYVVRHQDVVRRALRIRDDLAAESAAYVSRLRRDHDFLVGVMVRQGDYRQYLDGRFFFESPVYAAWMREALGLFGSRGRVGFLVASDEPQSARLFSGLPVHFTTGIAGGTGHYLESLAQLGSCDLVMSTASSFGCWGAFIGGVPVLPLVRIGAPLRIDDLLPTLWDCTQHPDLGVAIW